MIDQDKLSAVAKKLVAPGKGILAADESTGTIKKRFDKISVESTEETRRAYRELLFTTEGVGEFISGVIMYDETIRQKAQDGTPFPAVLQKQDIVPGIKVDEGTEELPGSPEEKFTKGIEGLAARLPEYVQLGAGFAKWRSVIVVGDGLPSDKAIEANAEGLAKYARACQEAGLVPIVEPEVLMEGSHDIDACREATLRTLKAVFAQLEKEGVYIPGILLKPNMVISGLEASKQASPEEIAQATLQTFQGVLPKDLPGVVFLSGGQSELEATVNLNEMNKIKTADQPWELSFSYGRALQASALQAWQGQQENVEAAQKAFSHRARMNSLARSGKYSEEEEQSTQ